MVKNENYIYLVIFIHANDQVSLYYILFKFNVLVVEALISFVDNQIKRNHRCCQICLITVTDFIRMLCS
jgi:hypothetical protein